jgi:ABC-type transporter Mla subunit MlaD
MAFDWIEDLAFVADKLKHHADEKEAAKRAQQEKEREANKPHAATMADINDRLARERENLSQKLEQPASAFKQKIHTSLNPNEDVKSGEADPDNPFLRSLKGFKFPDAKEYDDKIPEGTTDSELIKMLYKRLAESMNNLEALAWSVRDLKHKVDNLTDVVGRIGPEVREAVSAAHADIAATQKSISSNIDTLHNMVDGIETTVNHMR